MGLEQLAAEKWKSSFEQGICGINAHGWCSNFIEQAEGAAQGESRSLIKSPELSKGLLGALLAALAL